MKQNYPKVCDDDEILNGNDNMTFLEDQECGDEDDSLNSGAWSISAATKRVPY